MGGELSLMDEGAWLSGEDYDRLRAEEFERFCAAARTDLTAHVATCPEWDVAQLCDHLARVYQGRSMVIGTGAFPHRDAFETRTVEDPVGWVQRWAATLDDVLDGVADDAPTVTFMPGASTVVFWRRRMALETIVHRTDAELAVGTVGPMDVALSADGVAEMLWFATHPEHDHHDGIERPSVVELDDGRRRWVVEVADGTFSRAADGAACDATVRGGAPALLPALSGRDIAAVGPARLGVEPPLVAGDPAAYARLRARIGEF